MRAPEQSGVGQIANYVRGLAAWMSGDEEAALRRFHSIVDERGAASLQRRALTLPEAWALSDLGMP